MFFFVEQPDSAIIDATARNKYVWLVFKIVKFWAAVKPIYIKTCQIPFYFKKVRDIPTNLQNFADFLAFKPLIW